MNTLGVRFSIQSIITRNNIQKYVNKEIYHLYFTLCYIFVFKIIGVKDKNNTIIYNCDD